MTLVFVCVSSYVLAHIFSTLIAASLDNQPDANTARLPFAKGESDSLSSHGAAQRLAENILASRLFQHAGAIAQLELTALAGKSAIVKPLNASNKVALIGVALDANGTHQAVLETVSTRTQAIYHTHEQVPEVGELVAIEKDRVLFRRDSQEEWLDHILLQNPLKAKKPEESPSPPRPKRRILDRRHLAQVGNSPESYLKEAIFHPHISRGDIQGFRLEEIRQVGILDRAGLEEDDILAGVNGIPMRDPGVLWNIFRQLPNEDIVRFNVMRQGQPVTLTVEIRG